MSERRLNIISFTWNFSLRLAVAKNFSALSDKSERELYSFVTQTFGVLPEDTELDEIEKLVRTKAIGTSVYSLTVMPSDGWCQSALWIANLWFLVEFIPPSMIYREIHDVHSKFAEICAEATQSSNETDPEIISDACKIISDALSKDPPLTRKQIEEESRRAVRSRKEEIHERVEKAAMAAKQQRFSNGTVAVENSQKSEETKVTEETEEVEEDEETSTTDTIDNTQDLPQNRNQLVKEMETLLPDKECYLSGKIVEKFLKRARNISKTIDSYNVRPDIRRRIYLESIAFVFSNELCLHLLKSQIKNTIGNLSYSVDRERGEFFKSVSGMRNALKVNSDRENFTRQELAILLRRLNEYVYAILVEDDVDYLGTSYLSFDSLADAVAGCRQDPVGRTYLLFADYVYYTLLDRTDLTLGDLGPIYIDDLFDIAKISVPFGLITQAANSQTKEISREGSLTYYNTTNVFNNDVFVPSKAKTQQQEVGCLIFAILAVIALLIIVGMIITGG